MVQLPRRLGLFLSSTVRGIGSYARARPIAFAPRAPPLPTPLGVIPLIFMRRNSPPF